jgi:choline dehydrogenase
MSPAASGSWTIYSQLSGARPGCRTDRWKAATTAWLPRLYLDAIAAGARITEQLAGPASTRDDDIVASVRANSQTTYHPVGSCKMGIDEDAVVDS